MVAPAAQRFVRERRAEACLDTLAELTTQIFPDARQVSAELHEDPDVAGLRWVLIRVEVPWADGERARRARALRARRTNAAYGLGRPRSRAHATDATAGARDLIARMGGLAGTPAGTAGRDGMRAYEQTVLKVDTWGP